MSLPEGSRRVTLYAPLTDREHTALNEALRFDGKLKSRLMRELILDWLAEWYGSHDRVKAVPVDYDLALKGEKDD